MQGVRGRAYEMTLQEAKVPVPLAVKREETFASCKVTFDGGLEMKTIKAGCGLYSLGHHPQALEFIKHGKIGKMRLVFPFPRQPCESINSQ